MKKFTVFFLCATIAVSLFADTVEELQAFKTSFEKQPKITQNLMNGFMWTIIHDPSPKLKEEFFVPMENLGIALQGSAEQQQAFVKDNGITKFKKKLRENLSSNDPGLEALSALYLASMNDRESIPKIAKLLDIDRPKTKEHSNLVNIHRAAAAVSLAILEAADKYEEKIAKMLESQNSNDLYGAANVIIIMNWKKYLPEISKWFDVPDFYADKTLTHDQQYEASKLAEMRFKTAMNIAAHFKAKEYAPKLTAMLKPLTMMSVKKQYIISSLVQMDARDTAKDLANFYYVISKSNHSDIF